MGWSHVQGRRSIAFIKRLLVSELTVNWKKPEWEWGYV
jgi:hypothetical protein